MCFIFFTFIYIFLNTYQVCASKTNVKCTTNYANKRFSCDKFSSPNIELDFFVNIWNTFGYNFNFFNSFIREVLKFPLLTSCKLNGFQAHIYDRKFNETLPNLRAFNHDTWKKEWWLGEIGCLHANPLYFKHKGW